MIEVAAPARKRPRIVVDNFALNRDLVAAPTRSALLALAASHVAAFNAVNCATALHRLARFAEASGSAGGAPADAATTDAVLERTAAALAAPACDGRPPANARTVTSVVHAVGLLSDNGRCGAAATARALAAAAATVVTTARAGDGAAPGALATLLWAWGTRGASPAEPALVDAVVAAAAAAAPRMSAAEVSNAAWGCARCRLRHAPLLAALAAAAAAHARAGGFTEQGVATVAWAWAKLKSPAPALFAALAPAAVALLRRAGGGRDSQALAQLAWAFARSPDAGVNAAVCAALRGGALPTLPPAAVASLLQSLGGAVAEGGGPGAAGDGDGGNGSVAAPGVDVSVLAALAARALRLVPELGAQDVGLVAAAVARGVVRVPASESGAVAAALAARCAEIARDMDWRGVAAAELALRRLSGSNDSGDDSSDDECGDCAADGAGVDTIGGRFAAALAALTARAAAAARDVADASAAAARAAPDLLLRTLTPARLRALIGGVDGSGGAGAGFGRDPCAALPSPSSVLLIGDDPGGRVTAALAGAGAAATHWRRFTCDGAAAAAPPATPWPRPLGAAAADDPPGSELPMPPQPWCAAVFVRYPQSADAAAMAAHAAAAALPPGAPLLLYGCADEGATLGAVTAALRPLFGAVRVAGAAADGAIVLEATRAAAGAAAAGGAAVRMGLDAWRTQATLRLPAAAAAGAGAGAAPSLVELPWTTYPGLFAGGTLDVMTAALLAVLPPPPPRGRVVDFACGSGALGAALLAREPSLVLTLTDADAVAVAAATRNVPGARRVLLADGWPPPPRLRAGRRALAWVVSNPPVHRYQPDDFSVLTELLEGAPVRLRAGGVLWVVAQAQVPVGRLAAGVRRGGAGGAGGEGGAGADGACAAYASIRAMPVGGGRFVVWRAVAA